MNDEYEEGFDRFSGPIRAPIEERADGSLGFPDMGDGILDSIAGLDELLGGLEGIASKGAEEYKKITGAVVVADPVPAAETVEVNWPVVLGLAGLGLTLWLVLRKR